MSASYSDSNPAAAHQSGVKRANAAAAIALGVIYKAVWFNVAGTLNVVDSRGNQLTVTNGVGTYPVQNYGAVTGGTLADGEFYLLS